MDRARRLPPDGPPPLNLPMTTPIKLLCVIEATTVTGPAKNLLNFCKLMESPEFCIRGISPVEVSIVTFDRANANRNGHGDHAAPNAFVTAAREAGVPVDVIAERYRFDTSVVARLREIVARRAQDIIQTHIHLIFLIKLQVWETAIHGLLTPWIHHN